MAKTLFLLQHSGKLLQGRIEIIKFSLLKEYVAFRVNTKQWEKKNKNNNIKKSTQSINYRI